MAHKILIIDDEHGFADALRIRFQLAGYEVQMAFDGREGVYKARDFFPDLILLDVHMPDMNGGGTARLLQTDDTTAHIPVIFLTADIGEETPHTIEKHVMAVDAIHYPAFSKFVEFDYLLSKAKELINTASKNTKEDRHSC